MNWGRGLFRLWVIFSALWIAVLSAIFIVDGHLLEANKTYDIEGRFKEKYEVVAPPNASPAEVVAFAEENKRTDCSENKSGPWCDYPAKLQMPRKPIESQHDLRRPWRSRRNALDRSRALLGAVRFPSNDVSCCARS